MSVISANVPVVQARIGDRWIDSGETYEIHDPYRRDLIGHVPRSSRADLEQAIEAALKAKPISARMPAFERAKMLMKAADMVAARADSIGRTMSIETGKALKDARVEVERSADTLRLSAEEGTRIAGEHVPLDGAAMGAGKIGMVFRFPVGVVAAITPFNAPVNLAAHKIGPALAAGNVLVLKPSPKASLTVHLLVQALVDGGVPPGFLNVVYGDDIGPALVSDERIDFVTFTGSTHVGRQIRAAAGLKRVALELGGIGPTIVADDADIEAAAIACARNAMLLAGQSCVSVQNVHVHRSIADRFTDRVLTELKTLKVGDPIDPSTDIGTLIDEPAAIRVEGLIEQAVELGATLLAGGNRTKAQMQPAVLTGVDSRMKVVSDEIFGPAMTIQPYDEITDVFDVISNSPYGLQCGLFTNSLPTALQAIPAIRTGGIILNGTSRWRVDQMPYGGVKNSGIGREGPKYAIRDMTEERFVMFG